MDLWIRSQDKTDLVKANALWIMDNQIWMEVPFYENHKKLGLTITGHNHKLAEYATKERALEVLDEIQNKIAQNQSLISLMNNFTDLKGNEEVISKLFKDMIYEMPKD